MYAAGLSALQFEAAVKAGKHVFMEKPVAVDAPGVRRVRAANQEAKKKGLAVAVGHHLRHETKYREIVCAIHRGELGELTFCGLLQRRRRQGQLRPQTGRIPNAVQGRASTSAR